MLVLLWSRGLLFTAIITRMLSRTVRGHVTLLMMVATEKLTSSGTFRAVLPSTEILVVFVEFKQERLAMFREESVMKLNVSSNKTEIFINCFFLSLPFAVPPLQFNVTLRMGTNAFHFNFSMQQLFNSISRISLDQLMS